MQPPSNVTPCLPMAAGRYYFIPNSTSTGTNNALGNATMRAIPCFIPQCIAITKIGAEVTNVGEAGSKFRIGIYATDPATMRPGALVVDAGQIAGDSATVQELTVSGITIGPGWYWFAGVVQSAPTTQPTMRAMAAGSVVPPADVNTTIPSAGQASFGAIHSAVTAALPTTFVYGGLSGTNPARIFIKT